MQRDRGITSNMGMYYVCYKLSGLSFYATIKRRRPNIVVCKNEANSREVVIRVRSSSEQDAISLEDSLENIQGDFWIIVTRLNYGEPQTYILSSDEVKKGASQDGDGRNWLEPEDYVMEEFKEKGKRIVDSL